MDEIEIIELGEDGNFDIPSVRAPTKPFNISNEGPSHVVLPKLESTLRESIQPGEYKLFSQLNKVCTVVRLKPDELIHDLSLVNQEFVLKTSFGKYNLSVPGNINISTLIARRWKDFLTVSFELLS